jgi:hypothetical protein
MASSTEDDFFVAYGMANYDYMAIGPSQRGYVTLQDANNNPTFGIGVLVGGNIHGVSALGGPADGKSITDLQVDRYSDKAAVIGASFQFTGVAGVTDGLACGVYGQSGDVQGVPPGYQAGVFGASRVQPGVRGWSFEDTGVAGQSTTYHGVWGASMRGSGVAGQSGGTPFGPLHTDPRFPIPDRVGAAGVKGTCGEDFGVVGTSLKASGVLGQRGAPPTFDQNLDYMGGVTGTSSNAAGMVAVSQKSFGVLATSRDNHGIWASSGNDVQSVQYPPHIEQVAGVLGTSAKRIGVVGLSISRAGVVGHSIDSIGVYGESRNSVAGYFLGNVTVTGTLTATSKSAVVRFPDGSQRLLHCMESPEHWFEDFGSAKLRGGRTVVKLDGDFAKVVKLNDYRVFLTPEGDCRGLYVRRRRGPSFEVCELQGGTSDVAFSYRIVGKRRDVTEHKRFARIDLDAPLPNRKGSRVRKRTRGRS